MSIANLTSTQFRQAADLKDKIAGLEKQLSAILGGNGAGMPSPFKAAKHLKKGMSEAGRAKVAAAQRMRWSKIKAANVKTSPKPAKKKFVKSAAAKAKIVAAAKLMWAVKRPADAKR